MRVALLSNVNFSFSILTYCFRQINPVRFLEAQMACLRLSFQTWLLNDPEELDNDRPTEAEMEAFEEQEKQQEALVRVWVHKSYDNRIGLSPFNDCFCYYYSFVLLSSKLNVCP